MSILTVCELLGKFEHEVMEQVPPDQLARYLAYINIKNKEQEKLNKK